MGVGVSIAAVALGASVIERHFTLVRADGGVDSVFSLEPSELSALVHETERAWQALGELCYWPTEAELKSLVFRRTIYVAEDLQPVDLLSEEKLCIVRPVDGLAPKFLNALLGRPVAKPLKQASK